MRIALIGQAAFGESVLNALVARGRGLVAVFCPPDRKGRPFDPLKVAAEGRDIPVFQWGRLRDREAMDSFTRLNTDLGLMAYVTDIVPEAILNAPTRGTIQYHPSLLPEHRGPSSINWAIIKGETRTGLTIFWPNKGLGTGPVLLQKEVEIGPDDTVGSLYFNKLFPLGVEVLVEAVDMIENGTAPGVAQNEADATYEGWCRTGDVIIDWGRPVGAIYDLIRGSDPSPGAGTTFRGSDVRFYKAEKHDGEIGGELGEVVEVRPEGFMVAAKGGAVLIRRVQPEKSPKVGASEWMKSVGLTLGARFGTGLPTSGP